MPERIENRDEAGAYVTVLDGDVPGLTGFGLRFTNGDHHVATLSVGGVTYGGSGPSLSSFLLLLGDQDYGPFGRESGDPVRSWAEYMRLNGYGDGRLLASDGDCRGSWRLPASTSDEDRLTILSGFYFRTKEGNHHLRRLRVWPQSRADQIAVSWQDDDAEDRYTVDVLYVSVPRAPVADDPSFLGPFEESFEFVGSTRIRRRTGFALLRGFSFEFTDGDHHLLEVRIDLHASDDEIDLVFVDGEGNHPVRGRVSYVLFRQ